MALVATLASGAAMLLAAAPPASATHLTSVTLNSGVATLGTPFVVLSGVVDATSDASCTYGWDASSPDGVVSPSAQDEDGPVLTNYTLTVPTGALARGVYNVSVTVDWRGSLCLLDGPDGVANATIQIVGRPGAFGCRAVAGRLATGHFGEANPGLVPCQDDRKYSSVLPIGTLATVSAADSVTDQTPNDLDTVAPAPNDRATAAASLATVAVRVGPVRIAVAAVSAQAQARCSFFLNPVVSSGSQVVGLRINGGPARALTGYTRISVLGVTIELNKTTVAGTFRTQQALVISSIYSAGKLVIGEATAGYVGNPCGAIGP